MPNRTSGTKPGKNKSPTPLFIVGAAAVVATGAAGLAMDGKNSEFELTSTNEEIYSLQQQLKEQESELQTQIDELKDKNSETHRKSLKSNQAAAAVYNYKRALDWLNVCGARDYMPTETGTEPTSQGSLGVGYSYGFGEPGGEIVTLVGGQTSENSNDEHRNGDKTGYLESLQISRVQLNAWVSDSRSWVDAEERAVDTTEKVNNAAEPNKKQDTEEQ